MFLEHKLLRVKGRMFAQPVASALPRQAERQALVGGTRTRGAQLEFTVRQISNPFGSAARQGGEIFWLSSTSNG